eukprot:IDg12020t1
MKQTDLVGRECTFGHAYLAETVGRCSIEGSAMMLEVAKKFVCERAARSRKAKDSP